MLANPELRSPGPVRNKNRIAGLSADEIIALANRTVTTKAYISSQETGVPTELPTSLVAGQPSHLLSSIQWRYSSNINGFTKEQTLDFQLGDTLRTQPPSTAGVSTWEQSANEVRLIINDRYVVALGKFVDADHIQGTAGNKLGTTWTWTAERQ